MFHDRLGPDFPGRKKPDSSRPALYFGGPDLPPRRLRDLLEERVDAVRPGGAVDWMTYYFRDERLANALVRARCRGVNVRVCIDGHPYRSDANDAVIRRLAGEDGIGESLRAVNGHQLCHLHAKLYCFSDPEPCALVGSFNPSGNELEDDEVVTDIGDQDRGHNLLIEIRDASVVAALVGRVRAIHDGMNPFGRLATRLGRSAHGGGWHAYFLPRWNMRPLERRLAELGVGSHLRIAASHISGHGTIRMLEKLLQRGVEVELLTHHTDRRAPEEVMERLRSLGVHVLRYAHPDGLPMHCKFILPDGNGGAWSALGSFNLTPQSRWLNHELLVFCEHEEVWLALDRRWHEMTSEQWCQG